MPSPIRSPIRHHKIPPFKSLSLVARRLPEASRSFYLLRDPPPSFRGLLLQPTAMAVPAPHLAAPTSHNSRAGDALTSVTVALLRLCAPLESTIQEELSIKNPITYEWFKNDHHPVIVATLVNLFESDILFNSATKFYSENESSDSATASDLSLLMLALSCLAAVRKLGSSKVSCSQFSSMLPNITGRFMDLLLDFLPIKRAYKSMKEIDLRREFLFHFGPRVAIGEFDNEHRAEEMAFWIDLVQTQLQQAIDREKIWSRLTTCESIEFKAAEYTRAEIDEVRSEVTDCIQDHIYE